MSDINEGINTPDDIASIILDAKKYGFTGFGGDCGEAAIAINHILFNNKGKIVGVFNKSLFEHNRYVGHFAVEFQDVFWDSDARPKDFDDIESWGMLDPDDTDYIEFAEQNNFEWTDATASETVAWLFDNDEEVLKYCQHGKLKIFKMALQRAVKDAISKI